MTGYQSKILSFIESPRSLYMRGTLKCPVYFYMISELITLGSFFTTVIKKGRRAACRGAATDFVKYTIFLGAATKVSELLTKEAVRYYYGKKV